MTKVTVDVISDSYGPTVTLNGVPFLSVGDEYYVYIIRELVVACIRTGDWVGLVKMFLEEIDNSNEFFLATERTVTHLHYAINQSGYYIDPESKRIVVTCNNVTKFCQSEVEEEHGRVKLADGWSVEYHIVHCKDNLVCASYCSVLTILDLMKKWGVAYDDKS